MISNKILQELKGKGAEQYLTDAVPVEHKESSEKYTYMAGASVPIIEALVSQIQHMESQVKLEQNRYNQLLTKLENLNK